MDNAIGFGQQMKTIRAFRGLSQLELSTLVNIPNTYISDIERGKVLPTPEWEGRIRAALDWPADADAAFAILAGEAAHV